MDPRPSIIARRLAGAGRIVAVSGGKGGIGKSSVSVGLALALAHQGLRVGLLDLDFSGPSDHVILGVEPTYGEDAGLVPMAVGGIAFMSIASIVGAAPAPLRGGEMSDALIELLAVTRWGELDVLLLDMPPGFGDPLLDVARFIPGAEHLIVTTQSALVLETTAKALELMDRLGLPVTGLVENLRREPGPTVADRLGVLSVPLLGSIRYDSAYESSLGDRDRLATTQFALDVMLVARALAAVAGRRSRPAGHD